MCWSYTHYNNLCNGKTFDVPNGFWDYFWNIFGSFIVIGIVILIFYGIFVLIFD